MPFPGCGTGLATDEPGRWRRAAATGLALADYRRPHAPGAWSAAREPSGRDGDAQLPGAVNLLPESGGMVPALEFLDACQGAIDAKFTAVLDAVVAASPPRFSGGARWAIQG